MRTTRKLAKATGKVAKDVLSNRDAALWVFWALMAGALLLLFWAATQAVRVEHQNGTASSTGAPGHSTAADSTQSASSRP